MSTGTNKPSAEQVEQVIEGLRDGRSLSTLSLVYKVKPSKVREIAIKNGFVDGSTPQNGRPKRIDPPREPGQTYDRDARIKTLDEFTDKLRRLMHAANGATPAATLTSALIMIFNQRRLEENVGFDGYAPNSDGARSALASELRIIAERRREGLSLISPNGNGGDLS